MAFRELSPDRIGDNIFRLIGEDWMLLSAHDGQSFNTMTASWGTAGVLWHRPVVQAFVRPQRHTFGFMERAPLFTCCFFEERFRDALRLCGSRSGRDTDKMAATGLRPITEQGAVYYEQARLVLVCKKLYAQDIEPAGFVLLELDGEVYAARDYHRMYTGEIVRCLVSDTERN